MSTEKFPNKCDYCGLKQIFPPNAETETVFINLAALYKKGIVKQCFPRTRYLGDGHDRNEFCLVANPSWLDINAPCDDWELSPIELSKSDYLSLHSSKRSARSAESTEHMTVELTDMTIRIRAMTRWMLWITFFSAIAAGLSTYVATDEWINKSKQGKTLSTPSQTKTTMSLLPKKAE